MLWAYLARVDFQYKNHILERRSVGVIYITIEAQDRVSQVEQSRVHNLLSVVGPTITTSLDCAAQT
jgi:hypothetical protein